MWKSIFLIVASIKYVNAASQFKPRKKYITNCFNQDLIYSSPNPNPTKQPKPKLPISPHVGSAVPEMAPLHTVWPCLAHWEEFMIKLLARLTESAVMGGGHAQAHWESHKVSPRAITWLMNLALTGRAWRTAHLEPCWGARLLKCHATMHFSSEKMQKQEPVPNGLLRCLFSKECNLAFRENFHKLKWNWKPHK